MALLTDLTISTAAADDDKRPSFAVNGFELSDHPGFFSLLSLQLEKLVALLGYLLPSPFSFECPEGRKLSSGNRQHFRPLPVSTVPSTRAAALMARLV